MVINLMELSSEGLAIAAATREAVAAKKRHLEQLAKEKESAVTVSSDKPAAAKKPHLNRPPPVCSHEVAIPEGFDPSKITLDQTMHGKVKRAGQEVTGENASYERFDLLHGVGNA